MKTKRDISLDNVIEFPNRENEQESEEHVCDGCNSIHIHELSHQFTQVDAPQLVHDYYLALCDAFEDENHEDVIDILLNLFQETFDEGYKLALARVLQNASGMLAMALNEPDGEEQ